MEEHLIGSVYRGTMIDGKFTGNLRGDPPRVTGDGKHTIRELIEIKNQYKHPEIHDVIIKPQMEIFLARNNRSLEDILPSGKTIDLSEKIEFHMEVIVQRILILLIRKLLKFLKLPQLQLVILLLVLILLLNI